MIGIVLVLAVLGGNCWGAWQPIVLAKPMENVLLSSTCVAIGSLLISVPGMVLLQCLRPKPLPSTETLMTHLCAGMVNGAGCIFCFAIIWLGVKYLWGLSVALAVTQVTMVVLGCMFAGGHLTPRQWVFIIGIVICTMGVSWPVEKEQVLFGPLAENGAYVSVEATETVPPTLPWTR